MIGHQSISAFIYAIGLLPLFFIMMWPVPAIVKMMVICSVIFTMAGIGWVLYLISANSLQPAINKVDPEREEVWVEFSKNGLFTLKVAPKGAYGQTKGVMSGQKADIIDHGDFTIRFRNGNTGIIVYDLMSKNINLDRAVAWKQIFKKFKIRKGSEAYDTAKKSDWVME